MSRMFLLHFCNVIFHKNTKNHELRSKKSRIARYGLHKLNHELAKQRIAKTTNCEVYLYSIIWDIICHFKKGHTGPQSRVPTAVATPIPFDRLNPNLVGNQGVSTSN